MQQRVHQDRFLNYAEAAARLSIRESKLFSDIRAGLIAPPIKRGAKHSRLLEREIDVLILARSAGASDDEVRVLVKELVEARMALSPFVAHLRQQQEAAVA